MLRKNPFVNGEYYHIYNRGIDKRIIFKSKKDYERFVMLLYIANSKEFLAAKSVENENFTNPGISTAATVEVNSGAPLVRATEDMKESAQKSARVEGNSASLMNDGHNNAAMFYNGTN